MQMKPSVLAFASLLALPYAAQAQTPDWRRPDDGKFYWVLVDAKSIRRDAESGRSLFTYAHAGGPNYRSLTPLGTSRSQGAFNCATGRFYALRNDKWEEGSKGHMDGPIRAFVCKGK